MTHDSYKLIPDSFTPVPSLLHTEPALDWVEAFGQLDALGVLITTDGQPPAALGLDRGALERAGFTAAAGTSLVVPTADGPIMVAVGGGAAGGLGAHGLRDAVATLMRATPRHARVGFDVSAAASLDAGALGQAVAEGALLARYRYDVLRGNPRDVPLSLLQVRAPGVDAAAAAEGVAVGRVTARATNISRDLCNAPPSHLTAAGLGAVARDLGERYGFRVEEFGKEELIGLRCGGLLGVNAGSAQEPRMIKLSFEPGGEPSGHLGMVGKGIMYDSGGVSLKPSDPMHLLMKMDMGGAASVLASFTALRELGATAAATGFLMCTDNMPAGSAYKLGDVLTARNGTTIEVKNTDAEGRLVMCDALTLAVEEGVDAVVDVATLTGAALMALGPRTAALFGNDQPLVDEVRASAARADEQVWQLPLEHKYRDQLDSDIADISNLGGKYAGATTAALFLAEFVGDTPWAHLDISGTMQSDNDDGWRSKGATGFATRILIDLARGFSGP
ncbi:leucyl aminopeptidase family protein [Arthrobacter halodurans]|uniref:Probable cytosol aminopeptidase n=1 Tax=Arthrobacter halodurans TaxID=516699 RepID=A0ABV4UJT6_9MICC